MPAFFKLCLNRLLERIQDTTQINVRYFVFGGFWLTVGSALGSVSSLALAILFANLLTPETYGTYKYVLSIASILAITLLPGIDTAVQRAVARGNEGSVLPIFALKLRWGLLGSLGALVLSAYYFYQGNEILGFSFIVTALFLPLMDSVSMYDDLLRGRNQFGKATLFLAISQIVSTVVLAGFIFLSPTPPWVLLGYFLGWTLVRSGLLWYVLATCPPNKKTEESTASYGKHLSVMKGLTTVAGSIGSILLFQTIGGSALALFTFALAPIEQMRGWMNSSESLFLTRFAKDNWKLESFWWFVKKSALFFALLSAGIIVYCLAAPFLFSILFPQYMNAVVYSQAFAPSLLISALNVLLYSILKAKQEVKKLYIVNVASIVVSFITIVPFTYLWGIWGLLIASYLIKVTEAASLSLLLFVKRSEKQA